MLYEILAKIQRRNQISFLKKNPNVSFKDVRLKFGDHSILNKNSNKKAITKDAYFRNYIHILVEKNATLETGDHFHSEFAKVPVRNGSNRWLESNITILKEANTEENYIIGASCIICRDIFFNANVISLKDLMLKTQS